MNSAAAAAVFFTQTQRHGKKKSKEQILLGREKVGHTELIFHKVVERMPITSVSEFVVVVCRQLLQTLHCNCAEVAREGCIVCKHHCASGYKAVDKRLRPHPRSHAFLSPSLSLSLSLSLSPLKPYSFFPLHRNTLPSSVC
jgi:hypothetical protein